MERPQTVARRQGGQRVIADVVAARQFEMSAEEEKEIVRCHA